MLEVLQCLIQATLWRISSKDVTNTKTESDQGNIIEATELNSHSYRIWFSSFFAHMYNTCLLVWGTYVFVFVLVKAWNWHLVSSSIGLHFVEARSLTYQKLFDMAGPASQLFQRIPFLPPECWHFRLSLWKSHFEVSLGNTNYASHASTASALSTEPSLQPTLKVPRQMLENRETI